MSDNPLEDTPEREARIREQAYRLWEQDGGPHGRDLEYWERARELVGIEESPGAGLVHDTILRHTTDDGETIDEAKLQENLGEFPGRLEDQGDRLQTPMTRGELHEEAEAEFPLENKRQSQMQTQKARSRG